MKILMVHQFGREGAQQTEDRCVLEDCRQMMAKGHEVGGDFLYSGERPAAKERQWENILNLAQPDLLIVRGLDEGEAESLLRLAESLGVHTLAKDAGCQ